MKFNNKRRITPPLIVEVNVVMKGQLEFDGFSNKDIEVISGDVFLFN